MKKYQVCWSPYKGGRTQFRTDVLAPNLDIARALVGVPAQGEILSVTQHVQDLWTPVAKALVQRLEELEVKLGTRSLGD